MIYSLKGILELVQDNFIVVNCAGVGYKCVCSLVTKSFFSEKLLKEITVYTHLSVRQDAIELFGFSNISELESFKLLTSVSGVGPKAALGILSQFSAEKLSFIISDSDSKSLTNAPGIGPKTAKRIILELKDKFSMNKVSSMNETISCDISSSIGKKNEALNALMILGYLKQEVLPYLSNLSENLSIEEMIQSTLKYMSKGG